MIQKQNPADEPIFSENDVRQVIRLVAQTAAMNEPPAVCIRAMMDGLCELVGATYWTWIIIRVAVGEPHPMFIASLDNLPPDAKQGMVNSTLDPEGPDPNMPRMAPEVLSGKHITRTRQDLITDDEWYASTHYQKYRAPGNLDHCMHSVCPLKLEDSPLVLSLGLHRTQDQVAFDERERRPGAPLDDRSRLVANGTCSGGRRAWHSRVLRPVNGKL